MDKEFVDYLDKKFNSIDKRFSYVDKQFAIIDKRFDSVDKQIKDKFDKVLSGQDKIFKKLGDLEQENTASTELYKRHDNKIEEHDERILALEIKS
ncbi:MAG: hypothetical protein L6275_01140 [Candidatus Portnoybacteria bacterium]|nr:hypothetical protein [Candidatus Portnoybacteria bacterium]